LEVAGGEAGRWRSEDGRLGSLDRWRIEGFLCMSTPDGRL
jgi:hypothetical protein